MWFFILYLVLGVYILNFSLSRLELGFLGFITIPEILTSINYWAVLFGALVLIFECFKFLKKGHSERHNN